VREFTLVGTEVATNAPTSSPTTAVPTMAPTAQCKGEITWGDPHYTLMSFHQDTKQLNYQGTGWHHYIYPCDSQNQDAVDQWPFFLMSNHKRCNGAKSCIVDNELILNTKPDPWIIAFTNNKLSITVGSDITYSVGDFDTLSIDSIRSNDRSNPLEIVYNDGQSPVVQSGKMRLFMEKGFVTIDLDDVAFLGYPRTCNKGALSGIACTDVTGPYMCDGDVIEIGNRGSFTTSCPTCLRNIACGIMGKYTRGDCSNSDLRDTTSACYNVLQGSDGVTYTPPNSDSVFAQMADTWTASSIDASGVAPSWHAARGYGNLHKIATVNPKSCMLQTKIHQQSIKFIFCCLCIFVCIM